MQKLIICFSVLMVISGCGIQLKKRDNVKNDDVSIECKKVFDSIQSNWKPIRDFKPEEKPWYTTDLETITQFRERKFDPCLFTLGKSALVDLLGKPTYDRETPKSYPSPPDIGYECKVEGTDGFVIWFHLDKETGLVRYIDPSKVHSFH